MKVDIKNLSKKGRIDKLGFTFGSGDRIALIGPNGSGKSTLLQIIMGMLPADKGSVITNRAKFGVVFQDNILDETLNVLQNLKFRTESKRELESAIEILKQLRIVNLKQSYGALSGGQKRIVNVVRAVVSHPDILLLDELSAGMDIDIKDEAWRQIQNLISHNPDIAVVFTTHDLGELVYANKVLFIQNGQKKYFGSMDKFISQMPRYKLVIYNDNTSDLRNLEKRDTVKETRFFESSGEVISYLDNNIQLGEKDFEVKHTSFDDLFLNVEVAIDDN